jgi:hypothetical protein
VQIWHQEAHAKTSVFEPHMHVGIALHADIIDSHFHRVSPHVVCSMTGKQEAYKAMRQTSWCESCVSSATSRALLFMCYNILSIFACKYYGMLYRNME